MKNWGSIFLVVSIFALGLAVPERAKAMINVGGGWFCGGYTTTWTDFPGGGGGLTWTGVGCEYWGGFGGGGGGHSDPEEPSEPDPELLYGVPLSSLAQSAISAKLECALNEYTQSDAQPKYSIKNVDGYAYSKGSQMLYSNAWVAPSDLGSGWAPVGGTTKESPPHTSLVFKYAYNPDIYNGGVRYHITPTGVWPVSNPPDAFGTLYASQFTTFEWSLLTAAHEVAHQNGVALTGLEAQATWYGYAAVLAYRKDGGAKCD